MAVVAAILTVVALGLGFVLIATALGWFIDKVRDLARNR
jgi:hypothetical protein